MKMKKSWDRANNCEVVDIAENKYMGLMIRIKSENGINIVTFKENETNCTCYYKTMNFENPNKFCKHIIKAFDYLKNNKGCLKQVGNSFCGEEFENWSEEEGILTKEILYCDECKKKINKRKKLQKKNEN